MRAKRIGLMAAVLLLTISGLSCVPSKHPLSDEKTSKIDERLLGKWAVVDHDNPTEDGGQLLIGKKEAAEDTLESVDVQFDDDSHVVVNRGPMYATSVGGLTLISMPEEISGKEGHMDYVIVLYEFLDVDTVNAHFMDLTTIGASIANGDLRGSVTTTHLFGKTQYWGSKINASPEELRKYIEKMGKTCFDSDPWFTLQRVRSK